MVKRFNKRIEAVHAANQIAGRVMTSITSDFLSPPAKRRSVSSRPLAAIGDLWRQFCKRAFNPYRPELHYMRGPGPAWRAKHMAGTPAAPLMVAEIRTAAALRPAAR